MWSVRYYRDDSARPQLRCESREEAEFQRACLVASMLVRAQHASVVDFADHWIRTARNESVSTTAFRPEQ